MRSQTAVICLALLTSGASAAGQVASPRRYTVPELVKDMAPSIVHVAGLDARGGRRIGSGAILRDDGVIVTSYHLIQGAAAAQIRTQDGEIYDQVDVLDYDIRRDLIVLKIRPFRPLPVLSLAENDELVVGEDVAAIGNPEGLDASVSSGILSGRRQATGFQLIQTTAPISRGSSGGPLFNMQGRMIGVTTAQIREEGAQNLNFAVPVIYLRPLLEGRGQSVSVQEFTRKIAASPLLAARSVRDSSLPPESGMSWRVVHDHGGTFSSSCVGTLAVHPGDAGARAWEISFSSETASGEDWRYLLNRVSIAKNNSYGSNRGAFHVTLATRKNFNFYALDVDSRPADPGVLIGSVRAAQKTSREQLR